MSKELNLRERQLHMAQLIKKWDRMLVEKHGKRGYPFYHYQKIDAPLGERDNVCVVKGKGDHEYLPYGPELEHQANEARAWVRAGGLPIPDMIEHAERDVAVSVEQVEGQIKRGRLVAAPRTTPPTTKAHTRRMTDSAAPSTSRTSRVTVAD